MIKGVYVANVVIDFEVNESNWKHMMNFDEMKSFVEEGGLDRQIEKELAGPIATPERGIYVTVERKFAELSKEADND